MTRDNAAPAGGYTVTGSNCTNEAGAVVERLAYDPWGKRRFANGLADSTDSLVGQATHRGYTEHEHLDEVGVIHMNGRVYDPLVGRFMSADPFIQAPYDLRSFNRYSYVWNNPLVSVDPSGFETEIIPTIVVVGSCDALCLQMRNPPSQSRPFKSSNTDAANTLGNDKSCSHGTKCAHYKTRLANHTRHRLADYARAERCIVACLLWVSIIGQVCARYR